MQNYFIKIFEKYTTTKEMMEALAQKYDTTFDTHIQFLLEQYNSCKMKEGDSVIDHVNKMLVMAQDLAEAGNIISERMQISTILNSLSLLLGKWKLSPLGFVPKLLVYYNYL